MIQTRPTESKSHLKRYRNIAKASIPRTALELTLQKYGNTKGLREVYESLPIAASSETPERLDVLRSGTEDSGWPHGNVVTGGSQAQSSSHGDECFMGDSFSSSSVSPGPSSSSSPMQENEENQLGFSSSSVSPGLSLPSHPKQRDADLDEFFHDASTEGNKSGAAPAPAVADVAVSDSAMQEVRSLF